MQKKINLSSCIDSDDMLETNTVETIHIYCNSSWRQYGTQEITWHHATNRIGDDLLGRVGETFAIYGLYDML